ncbi:hypothetical protein [Leptospira interrogans]|nr:hypothetical protein [Leptospira interrogans]
MKVQNSLGLVRKNVGTPALRKKISITNEPELYYNMVKFYLCASD